MLVEWHDGNTNFSLFDPDSYDSIDESQFDGVENLLENTEGDTVSMFTYQLKGRVRANMTQTDNT